MPTHDSQPDSGRGPVPTGHAHAFPVLILKELRTMGPLNICREITKINTHFEELPNNGDMS